MHPLSLQLLCKCLQLSLSGRSSSGQALRVSTRRLHFALQLGSHHGSLAIRLLPQLVLDGSFSSLPCCGCRLSDGGDLALRLGRRSGNLGLRVQNCTHDAGVGLVSCLCRLVCSGVLLLQPLRLSRVHGLRACEDALRSSHVAICGCLAGRLLCFRPLPGVLLRQGLRAAFLALCQALPQPGALLCARLRQALSDCLHVTLVGSKEGLALRADGLCGLLQTGLQRGLLLLLLLGQLSLHGFALRSVSSQQRLALGSRRRALQLLGVLGVHGGSGSLPLSLQALPQPCQLFLSLLVMLRLHGL